MSKTIDERVVEMRFDNKQFEANVATSMSTLDKLKRSLKLDGAAKSLEGIDKAAKNVNMSGLGNAVETVSAKFSALQVMGVTALANITNSAVNAGKRMVKALTIDPVMGGFREYETQINSVQTILSNTRQEGTDVKIVNRALDELNAYADKTIYNFTEMTRNIGTFTAAGVKLDTSVNAIKGIANLAAVSGSTSQQASTAMYQLSQALAAGKVSLMDWNSVVNAGMGGKVFQDALVRTSELLGTGAKSAIDMYGSFRESLTKGEWLTTEVLTETLNQLAGAYSEADLIAQGFTESQAKEIIALAEDAESAAQDVKTFTQLWDVMKEAAQSGWSKTWRLIVGDFKDAKTLLTPLADFFTGIIGKMSDARNNLLGGALGSPFGKLIDQVSGFTKTTKETVETVKDLGEVVDKVINGDFGDGQERFNKLTEAGYNWMEVQNKVNEKLGDSHRYTKKEIEAQDKLLKTKKKVIDGEEKTLGQLAKMSDAKLKDAGMTEEQIKALRELEKQAKKSRMSIDDFVKEYDGMDGRTMIIESLKNAGSGLIGIFKAMGNAWREVFDPMTAEQLYDIVQKLYDMSSGLRLTDAKTGELTETAKKLQRTFKGVFAALDIVRKVLGGGLKIAFEILKQVLAAFDMDILDVTANIGDAIYKFNEWIESNGLITKAVKKVVPAIVKMVGAVKEWIAKFKELPFVQKVIEKISGAFERLGSMSFDDVLNGLKSIKETVKSAFSRLFDGVGEDTIAGLINGLKAGIGKAVSIVIEIGTSILNAIKEVLGIHSPSTEMHEVGENAIDGLYNGLKAGISKIVEIIKEIAGKFTEIFNKIDWNKVFAGGAVVGLIYTAKKIGDALSVIASPLVGLGDLMSGVGDVLSESAGAIKKVIKNFALIEKSFSKVMKSFAFKTRAEGIKELAIAIAIIAGAIAVLSLLDTKKLWHAVGQVAVLAIILVGLAIAMDKMTSAGLSIDKESKKLNVKTLSSGLMGIASALLVVAYAVKIMGSLSPEQYDQGLKGMGLIIAGFAVVMLAFWGISKLLKSSTADFGAMGKSLLKMSVAMLIIVGVVKLAGTLSEDDMKKGAAFAGAFIIFVGLLTAITKLLGKGDISKLGGLVIKLSIAMLLLVGVVKLAGTLSEDDMKKGAAFAGAFIIFVGLLTGISRIAGAGKMGKLGGLLLSISISMMLMVGVCKLATLLDLDAAIKGGIFAGAFLVFVAILTKVTTITNTQQTAKMAATILAMSVAIGILAGVCILLGLIDLPSLAKGVAAVTVLGLLMTAMIWATRGANDVKGNLIVMTVAIGVMAAAIIALSFIDPTQLAGATAAIGILMGIFTLMVKVAGTAQTAMGPLIVMAVVVGLFGAILYLLSDLPIESTLGVAGSLSMMLIAMALVFAILGTFGGLAGYAIAGAIGMMAVIAIIGAVALVIGGLMSLIPQETIDTWKTGLQNFMDFIVILAGGLGEALGAFIGGAMAGIMGALPGIADSLSLFMDKLTPFLDGVKMVDSSVLTGVGILAAAIIALTVADLINGIASFMSFGSSFADLGTQLSQFFINSLPFIVGMSMIDPSVVEAGKSLAEMILILTASDLISGIASFIGLGGSSMTDFAAQLVPFGEAICAFSNTIVSNGGINSAAVEAAATAGKVMAELQKAIPKTGGWVQDILGESDMEKFSAGISAFGTAIVDFSKVVSEDGAINSEAIRAAAEGGKALSDLQSSIPKTGGWAQAIMGESDMIKFSKSIVAFGTAITRFSRTVSAEGALDPVAIETASKSGTLMAELQKSIPKTGGWAQAIMGEKDLATFGASIKAFGEALTDFSDNVNINDDAVAKAVTTGSMMAVLQDAIPEEHLFDGKMSLDDFGKKIKKFGEGIKGYSEQVAGMDATAVSSSITSADRIVSLARGLVDLDTSGMDDFKPKKIGEAMKKYSDEVSGIDASLVSSSISSAKKLAAFIGTLASLNTKGVSKFKVASIGKSMKSYSNSVDGMNAGLVSSSISSAKNLASFINSLSTLNTSGVNSFKVAVSSLAKTDFAALAESLKGVSAAKFTSVGTSIVEGIIKGFKSKQPSLMTLGISMINKILDVIKSRGPLFLVAGMGLISKLISGMESQRSKVITAAVSSIKSASSSIRGYYGSFYSAGSYLVTGFANGISANSYKAAAKAKAMAKAAKQAAEEALGIASPSKVFYKIGDYTGQGFVNALGDYGDKSYRAGSSMADSARFGLRDAISKIRDLIDSDMDVQPTIRPVLDLSDVRSGAGAIGSMLEFGSSRRVQLNVGAANIAMNRRIQNGNNTELISAIDKLRRDLGTIGNTTYSINGITYDDGSNISEAIQTIVRAARIERRV